VSSEALGHLPSGARVLGALPHGQTDALYRAADVLVAPTLSDGFGLTQLEAMSRGVPVITTPHCGRVVDDGVDGFVVPARDAGAIAARLTRLREEPDLLGRMQAAAARKAAGFTLQRYGDELTACIDRAIAGRSA
jgi:glycosyltransferase involved in cell wall biosynthesis